MTFLVSRMSSENAKDESNVKDGVRRNTNTLSYTLWKKDGQDVRKACPQRVKTCQGTNTVSYAVYGEKSKNGKRWPPATLESVRSTFREESPTYLVSDSYRRF